MHPREGWSEGGIRRGREPREGAISRRQLLMAGAGLALGGMLAGCSSTNPAAGSGNPPLPRQDSPVKWPVYADNKPIASGLAPRRARPCSSTTGSRTSTRRSIKSFCKKHNCKYSLTTYNTMEEALAKLASGELEVRRVLPDRRRARPVDRGQADPAAQPQLHPEHGQHLARLSQSVLRPGLAVHDAVLDLHHRDGLAQGQGEPRPVVEHAVAGGALTRARSRSWTTTARRSAWR